MFIHRQMNRNGGEEWKWHRSTLGINCMRVYTASLLLRRKTLYFEHFMPGETENDSFAILLLCALHLFVRLFYSVYFYFCAKVFRFSFRLVSSVHLFATLLLVDCLYFVAATVAAARLYELHTLYSFATHDVRAIYDRSSICIYIYVQPLHQMNGMHIICVIFNYRVLVLELQHYAAVKWERMQRFLLFSFSVCFSSAFSCSFCLLFFSFPVRSFASFTLVLLIYVFVSRSQTFHLCEKRRQNRKQNKNAEENRNEYCDFWAGSKCASLNVLNTWAVSTNLERNFPHSHGTVERANLFGCANRWARKTRNEWVNEWMKWTEM